MSAPKEYYDLLHAYALGCLDAEDFNRLIEYFKEAGDYPWQELGEYQNLVALLPSILNIEIPEIRLKDKVARKLYRIKDEIRDKRTRTMYALPDENNEDPALKFPEDEKKIDFQKFNESAEPPEEAEEASEEILNEPEIEEEKEQNEVIEEPVAEDEQPEENFFTTEKLKTNTQEFEVVTSSKNTSSRRPSQDTQIRGRNDEVKKEDFTEEETEPELESEPENVEEIQDTDEIIDLRDTSENENELDNESKANSKNYEIKHRKSYYEIKEEQAKGKKGSFVSIFLAVLLVIVISVIAVIYFKLNGDVKNYKSDIDKLNRQVNTLSNKVSTNQDLQSVLQAKNVRIVDLKPTKLDQDGYGKLIISFDNSKGYLQLSPHIELPDGKAFQLWVAISGVNISLGVYQPQSGVEYFPFTIPELSNQTSTKFIITEEPVTGSSRPSKNIVLDGTLQ